MLYFSDCQSGAASSCVAGNNANAGTQAAPKRDLSGINLHSLRAGTTLLFARGGAWNISRIDINNANTSAANPLSFDAWGSGSAPLMRVASGIGIQLGGGWGNTDNDGGYVFRNLRLQGTGSDSNHWGFWLVQNVRGVTIENVEMSGFGIAIHASGGSPYGVSNVAIRNSNISRNRSMGFLGPLNDSTFENNLFEGNNLSGSGFDHALYLSGGNNNVVRNNRFIRNSVVNGVCTGGNFTIHGVADGLLIENNRVEQDSAAPGCYPFSITAGYDYAESFRNVVMRGNTVINGGVCAFCINSSPGIVIESNVIHASANWGHNAIMAEANGSADTPSSGATIRNNTICRGSGGSTVQAVTWGAAGATISNNVIRTGSDASSGVCAR